MAQNFSLRYMLIDGQGNFGSQGGDPPAAMRYTEIRMQKLAEAMVEDIEKVLGMVRYTENLLHSEYTSRIIQAVLTGKKETVGENVIAAGKIRRFLG